MTRLLVIVLSLTLVLTGCGDDDNDNEAVNEAIPTERGDGGTLPIEDNPAGMSASEHHDAACDEIRVVRNSTQAHGDQLNYIISHTGAANNEELDETANDWAKAIADGDIGTIVTFGVRLGELCEEAGP